MHYKIKLYQLLLLLFCTTISAQKMNVLFIAVDDLKPVLGCYGDENVFTPNIDKLAAESIVFTNAHCQQAVCGPTRASLMTGMRPDYTGVWDLKTRMRDVNPDILSMPEHFRQKGYETVAIGKIYDPRCVGKKYDGVSWSIPYSESAKYTYPEGYDAPGLSYYASKENQKIVAKFTQEAKDKGIKNVHGYVSDRFKPSVECADVPDEAYIDAQISNNAIGYMKKLSQKDKPFFVAVGFKRPHLPFAAPKKYWDMYQRDEIQLAKYPKAVKNGVDIAYHTYGEMRSYTDIPFPSSFTDIFTDQIPEDKQRELIHGYYASTSYIDAQVGKLMEELKSSGLDKNTVVILWGDHGWHLGDHAMWCKHSNFEQATRVPMIISVPDGGVGDYSHPVEFVDIFPTLCDAAGLEKPSFLQGSSLMPLFDDLSLKVKEYAVSQFPRGKNNGYSLRTDRYRLTLWMKNKYKSYNTFDEELLIDGELYDYKKDPLETTNYYDDKKYKKVRAELMNYFKEFIATQNEELKDGGPALSKKR
jgi:iduronate 2-sulfatase